MAINRAKNSQNPNSFRTPSHAASTNAPANSMSAAAASAQPTICAPRKRSFRSGIAARFSFGAEEKNRLC